MNVLLINKKNFGGVNKYYKGIRIKKFVFKNFREKGGLNF